jgi:hypothetical protein
MFDLKPSMHDNLLYDPAQKELETLLEPLWAHGIPIYGG